MKDSLTFLIPEMQRQNELLRDSMLLKAAEAAELMRVSRELDRIPKQLRSQLDDLRRCQEAVHDLKRAGII